MNNLLSKKCQKGSSPSYAAPTQHHESKPTSEQVVSDSIYDNNVVIDTDKDSDTFMKGNNETDTDEIPEET